MIAIGNPGAGKSTILNSVAREILFQSGISYGNGLTYELDRRNNNQGTFFDTPGLADDTYREAAGKAISTALRTGGNFKILFFVTQRDGRVVRQDVTTLRLVLDAAPEIGNHYGLVINKVPKPVAERLKDPETEVVFLNSLFIGLEENRRCTKSDITYLLQTEDLEAKNNQLISLDKLETLDKTNFEEWLIEEVDLVCLTVDGAGDIDTKLFEKMNSEMTEKMSNMEQKMEQNREIFEEETQRLMDQLQKTEKEKSEQRKRDQEKHQKELREMQRRLAEMSRRAIAAKVARG